MLIRDYRFSDWTFLATSSLDKIEFLRNRRKFLEFYSNYYQITRKRILHRYLRSSLFKNISKNKYLLIKNSIIGIAEFISATDLGSILNRMQPEKQDKENIPNIVDLHAKNTRRTNYRSEMLSEKHKDAVYR